MKQVLLLVQLRSHHPETVRAALLAALVAWAFQEEEGQALLRQLASGLEVGQENLVQAYLPLLEPWEAGELVEEARLSPPPSNRQPVGHSGQLYHSLAWGRAWPVESGTGVVVFAPLETVFLSQPQATLAPSPGISGMGPTASPGNAPSRRFPVTRLKKKRVRTRVFLQHSLYKGTNQWMDNVGGGGAFGLE